MFNLLERDILKSWDKNVLYDIIVFIVLLFLVKYDMQGLQNRLIISTNPIRTGFKGRTQ